MKQFTILFDEDANPDERVWRLWNEDPGQTGNPACCGWWAEGKTLSQLIPTALRLAAAGHDVIIEHDNNA